MKKTDYPTPETHLFYCDKSNWFDLTTDKEGKQRQDWSKSEDQRKAFWQQVRAEKMDKGDLDFSHFVFPLFTEDENTFWKQGTKKEFKKRVNFYQATFLGVANFNDVTFGREANFYESKLSEKVTFNKAHFVKEQSFLKTKFLGDVDFSFAIFSMRAHYQDLTFEGKSNFIHTAFLDDLSFLNARFKKNTAFLRISVSKSTFFESSVFEDITSFAFSIFSGITKFIDLKFLKSSDFQKAIFNDKTDFEDLTFLGEENHSQFHDTQFLEVVNFFNITFISGSFYRTKFVSRVLFRIIKIKEIINFNRIIITAQIGFDSCFIEKINFEFCNLSKINFVNCSFKRNIHGRILLLNDKTATSLDDLSNTYRQLKRSFMESKDWTTAGDAYRSEMVIKRKATWKQIRKNPRKIINWCIMMLHDALSGYQQSFGRPLFWLATLWVVCPLWLYCLDMGNLSHSDKLFTALQTSSNAALPVVGRIEVDACYPKGVYFLLLFERIFSVILLTFFGLATRARLRQ